ncbi:N-acetyltransferase [Microbacterium pseudoresistens]|uniref:Putative GNAT family acetyltransferase n=1 Tax=Microbacterium pseudoresistens TaxID=640634 RepID=A0A7Y9JMP9_9MICO|nr:GNAT family N-acetyltransferase [Microbacterium pseudoresistens]NYD53753.1 putative GNAT family acetyltransferase [Microbacterium pseudoresistens]
MTDIAVTRKDDASRYEIHHDGTLAGFVEFELRPDAASADTIRFVHTEIDPAFQGKGLAGRLAGDALADAVARELEIVPLCPYIARYADTHDIPGARVRPAPETRPAQQPDEQPGEQTASK